MAASNAVMRRVALHAILLFSGMAAAVSAGPKPPPVPTPEFQSKAARLARFAQVTNWPANKLPRESPLVIGVFGNDLVCDYLREALGGRRLRGREVIVKRGLAVQEVLSCHVIFIGSREQDVYRDVLRKAIGEPILTIGESDTFLDRGGIITMAMINGSAQFTFDSSNLKRSRLEIDPETLALANPPPRR